MTALCPHCNRPEGRFEKIKPVLDGRGPKCYANAFGVPTNEADAMADCEAARRLGTAGVYEEGERIKREYVQETLKIV